MRFSAEFAVAVLASVFCASLALGQSLRLGALPSNGSDQAVPQTTRSDDPWYMQYYGSAASDPRTLIWERAQFYAQQRQLRIASRAWYGISVSRPTTTADIMFADRAPRWTSGSVLRPYHWSFRPASTVIILPAESPSAGGGNSTNH
ncbi:MAG: hypothetical protein NZ899_02115 [Thermoguttaceae bacterium]|nr:hypothetical protein [Thermoguttaceae bacterium]MDW8078730.1 hypothetical protein [Thermoguttaceae bacterium]